MDNIEQNGINIILPDYLKNLNSEIKKVYVERETLRQTVDNHPLRWYTIENEEGETVVLDAKTPTPSLKNIVKEFYRNNEEPREAIDKTLTELGERRVFFQKNYYHKVIKLSKKYNKLMASQEEVSGLDIKEKEILDMFGRYRTNEEISEALKRKWGYKITPLQIKRWAVKHEAVIEKKKADYVLNNKEFRVAHEAGRLEVLNAQLAHFQAQFDKRPTENLSRLILHILEQARKEVKGNDLKLTVDGKIDIKATIQGQANVRDIDSKLPINMLVLGLTAAKMGVHPLNLMTALATSYYAPQNGFGELSEEELKSPTHLISNMNWDSLTKKANDYKKKQKENDIAELTEFDNVEQETTAKKTKEDLLNSLKNLGTK